MRQTLSRWKEKPHQLRSARSYSQDDGSCTHLILEELTLGQKLEKPGESKLWAWPSPP